jgi:hypothetical protein
METSLHRQLKQFYGGPKARFEAPVAGYRVDVVDGRRLIEIQHGALGAIRDKVQALVQTHRVVVVKPIIRRKVLVKLAEAGGEEVSRRLSPKQGRLIDLFHELVHFTRAFPHPRLTLEVALVDVEERRYPGHGRRRRWRVNDFQVEDLLLTEVCQTVRLKTVADLCRLLKPTPDAAPIAEPFDTGQLAAMLGEPRWIAQRIAYCLTHMGGLRQVGKQGNARLYRWRRRAA